MGDKTQETIADIIAEMRGIRVREFQDYADRLEAALKREVDVLKQRCAELNAEIAAKDAVIMRLNDAIAEEQRRKMATPENSSVVGDAAKLREALITIRDKAHEQYVNDYGIDTVWIQNVANAALAAPPRNCDVFSTKDTAREAFQKLRGHCVWADVSLWDDRDEIEAFLDWLFAPATEKEGGDDEQK